MVPEGSDARRIRGSGVASLNTSVPCRSYPYSFYFYLLYR